MLTVLADSMFSTLIFFAEKSYSHFFSKQFQHNCVSLDVNFNESLTNDIVSFEQLGPGLQCTREKKYESHSESACICQFIVRGLESTFDLE